MPFFCQVPSASQQPGHRAPGRRLGPAVAGVPQQLVRHAPADGRRAQQGVPSHLARSGRVSAHSRAHSPRDFLLLQCVPLHAAAAATNICLPLTCAAAEALQTLDFKQLEATAFLSRKFFRLGRFIRYLTVLPSCRCPLPHAAASELKALQHPSRSRPPCVSFLWLPLSFLAHAIWAVRLQRPAPNPLLRAQAAACRRYISSLTTSSSSLFLPAISSANSR